VAIRGIHRANGSAQHAAFAPIWPGDGVVAGAGAMAGESYCRNPHYVAFGSATSCDRPGAFEIIWAARTGWPLVA